MEYDNIFAFMIRLLLIGKELCQNLTASHLVDGLLYLMSKFNMSPVFMPIVCFAICGSFPVRRKCGRAMNNGSTSDDSILP